MAPLENQEGKPKPASIVAPATPPPGPPTSVGTWGGGLQSAVKMRTGNRNRPPHEKDRGSKDGVTKDGVYLRSELQIDPVRRTEMASRSSPRAVTC